MRVFVSYRRSDTKDLAGRLSDRLRQELQIQDVFFDIEEIDAGASFESRIQSSLKKCAVCVVLIGSDWLGKRDSGAARIFEERDFVRLEVREALAGKAKVIPVLVNGAAMPGADELPADLQRLPALNAVSLRHESFSRDADFLTDAVLARKAPGPLHRYWVRHPFQEGLVRSFTGILVVAALLVGAAAAHQAVTGLALNQALGGVGPVLMLAVGGLSAGAILPLIFRGRRRRTPK